MPGHAPIWQARIPAPAWLLTLQPLGLSTTAYRFARCWKSFRRTPFSTTPPPTAITNQVQSRCECQNFHFPDFSDHCQDRTRWIGQLGDGRLTCLMVPKPREGRDDRRGSMTPTAPPHRTTTQHSTHHANEQIHRSFQSAIIITATHCPIHHSHHSLRPRAAGPSPVQHVPIKEKWGIVLTASAL